MSLSLAIGTAIWLGILTSISPCPMATNIAAISFIGRQVGKPRFVLCSGGLYVLGRTVAYILLAVLLLAGLMASDVSSRFLQKYLNLVLGPVLIIVGLVLLEMLGESISINLAGKGVPERAARGGALWSAALGFLFALSFCPVSAGLYFGALLPLAAGQESRLLVPGLYGIGTALPVVAFAFLIAFGGQYVGKAFHRLTQIERRVRVATGVIFVLAGLYLSLVHIYGMPSLTW
jgi:cytochrome c biogenesis protein CcdA